MALNSVSDILATAGVLFPMVTVHTDKNVSYIGAVVRVDGGVVWMQDIGPDAIWDARATARSLEDVTRIDFGGAYEAALALVGGPAPEPVEARPPLRLVADNG